MITGEMIYAMLIVFVMSRYVVCAPICAHYDEDYYIAGFLLQCIMLMGWIVLNAIIEKGVCQL